MNYNDIFKQKRKYKSVKTDFFVKIFVKKLKIIIIELCIIMLLF